MVGFPTVFSVGTLIVLNKHDFSPLLFLMSRLFMLLFSAVIIIVFSEIMGYSLIFTMIIFFIKSTDAIIDLNFGFLQLKGSFIALKEYAILHVSKFIIIAFLILLSYFSFVIKINTYLIIIGIFLLISSLIRFINTEEIKFTIEGINLLEIKSLFLKSFVFVLATTACAFLTNSPRFFLDAFVDGDLLGVLGICLSVSTLFGMVFNTNWQRYFSNLNKTNNRFSFSIRFFTQNILLGIFLASFAFFVLPYPVSIFFKIDLEIYMKIMQEIFLSFIIFNLGMSSLNLYKWTNSPVIESYSYFFAFIISFWLALVWKDLFKINHLFYYCNALSSIYSINLIKKENEKK